MNELIDRFNAVPLTNKIIVLFLLMIGLAAAYIVGLHLPLSSDIEQTAQRVQALDQVHQQLDQVEERITEVTNEIDELNRDLDDEQQQEALMEPGGLPDLVEDVFEYALGEGLEINDWRQLEQRESDSGDYLEVPVQLEIYGTFDQVLNFFEELGQGTPIVNIQDVRMQRESSDLHPFGDVVVQVHVTSFMAQDNQS